MVIIAIFDIDFQTFVRTAYWGESSANSMG